MSKETTSLSEESIAETPEIEVSNREACEEESHGLARRGKGQDIAFVVMALGCILLFMALFTYSPDDRSWSADSSAATTNAVGQVGAVLSDALLHGFGYLAFAIPTLILAKLSMMFGHTNPSSPGAWVLRLVGMMLTLIGLCALASVSIWEGGSLPVGAGGVVGVAVFSSMSPLFGFPGSVVLLAGLLSLGLMLFLEFSWMALFDWVGDRLVNLFTRNSAEQRNDHEWGNDAVAALPYPNYLSSGSQPLDDALQDGESEFDELDNYSEKEQGHDTFSAHRTVDEESHHPRSSNPEEVPPASALAMAHKQAVNQQVANREERTHLVEPGFGDLDDLATLVTEPPVPSTSGVDDDSLADRIPTLTPDAVLANEDALCMNDAASDGVDASECPNDSDPSESTVTLETERILYVEEVVSGGVAEVAPVESLVSESLVPEATAETSESIAHPPATDAGHRSVVSSDEAAEIPWDDEDTARATKSRAEAMSDDIGSPAVASSSVADNSSDSISGIDIPIEPLEKRADSQLLDSQVIRQHAQALGLPSVDVLDPPKLDQKSGFSPERLQDMSALLVQKLADFGVKIEVVAVAPGPVITRFEIQPAPGVKASKITNLAKDLARSMAMISVRVVEVIPGKSVMGIEVPNENRAIVSLSEVLASSAFDKSESVLTLALGHDIGGNPVVANLAKMPHLLVAGTTGSGKSVGVNAMILSMLFKATPEELRLIMVDPKMLELSIYEGIPHLLTPVITDMKEAANGLRWCVEEMERRYQLLASQGVRNILSYNKKVQAAIDEGHPILDPLWSIEVSYDTTPRTLEPLPFIVIVVDEFADMIMMVGKKVEEYIARIAQKARAAGIHMILATQRPSVDVITGLIKANVPTRIAFQVSSRIDSRTILDQGGAEQLLGYGDMLFMPPGLALPERIHGAFVDDDEVHRVVAEWKLRGEPNYIENLTQSEESAAAASGDGTGGDEQDELFDEAVAFVTQTRKCSASGLQRKMRIGYNRAARLVESMEAAGIVSLPGNNGAREVLAPPPPDMN